MTTATTYPPLTITELDKDGWDSFETIADGQGLAMAAIGFTEKQFEPLLDLDGTDHPGVIAWEHLIDEVIQELSPQIRDLILEALQRRLPWTWSPVR